MRKPSSKPDLVSESVDSKLERIQELLTAAKAANRAGDYRKVLIETGWIRAYIQDIK